MSFDAKTFLILGMAVSRIVLNWWVEGGVSFRLHVNVQGTEQAGEPLKRVRTVAGALLMVRAGQLALT